jgi:hypothetical protein
MFWPVNVKGEKRPFGILRHRLKDNIKINHKKIGCEGEG